MESENKIILERIIREIEKTGAKINDAKWRNANPRWEELLNAALDSLTDAIHSLEEASRLPDSYYA